MVVNSWVMWWRRLPLGVEREGDRRCLVAGKEAAKRLDAEALGRGSGEVAPLVGVNVVVVEFFFPLRWRSSRTA
jgi:hypothetical protein